MIGKHIFFMKIKKIDSSKSVLQMHIAQTNNNSQLIILLILGRYLAVKK
jgi:hypothetical protein